MKLESAAQNLAERPFFKTGALAAGNSLAETRLQISRWVKSGKLMRLGKGLYAFAAPYRKIEIDPLAVAQGLKPNSYISLHTALGCYGLIPEGVMAVTSVTTGRPQSILNGLGRFEFRHVNRRLFWGYKEEGAALGCRYFMAHPEKALLDLLYLTAGSDRPAYLEGLRLQHLETLDVKRITEMAERMGSGKVFRGARCLVAAVERALAENNGIDL
jgi:predicted transcriptional regulator of viral defense system